jgi:hypothetical protein
MDGNYSSTLTRLTSHRVSTLQFSDKNIPFKFMKGIIGSIYTAKVSVCLSRSSSNKCNASHRA